MPHEIEVDKTGIVDCLVEAPLVRWLTYHFECELRSAWIRYQTRTLVAGISPATFFVTT